MAERLTKKDKPILKNQMEDNMSVNKNTAIKRLWQYENVMEKYGIESVEELDKKLADSITWQKACELACQIIISECCDCIEDTTDWDSAVEEWKEYNNIETYGIGVEELLGYLLEKAKKESEN